MDLVASNLFLLLVCSFVTFFFYWTNFLGGREGCLAPQMQTIRPVSAFFEFSMTGANGICDDEGTKGILPVVSLPPVIYHPGWYVTGHHSVIPPQNARTIMTYAVVGRPLCPAGSVPQPGPSKNPFSPSASSPPHVHTGLQSTRPAFMLWPLSCFHPILTSLAMRLRS